MNYILFNSFISFVEIHKSASESSISEASQHSNTSTQSDKPKKECEPPVTSERRKSSFSGAKSLHEIKSSTVDHPNSIKNNEGL